MRMKGVPPVSLDREDMRKFVAMTDDIGVLSVYVTLDPHRRAESAAKPSWELRLRSQLAEVQERVKRDGPREHHVALAARLEELQVDLERLLDPATPGQGRALFTGIADGPVHQVSVQVPLVDRVALAARAHLRPLVTAWSLAGPAGAVAVSADEVRTIDLRFGWTDEVAVIQYTNNTEQRELKGPAAANPAMSQHSAPQHDLFERREEDKLLRFLRTVGPRLAEQAARRGWEHLVVTGKAHLAQAVADGLPAPWADEVVILSHPVATLSRAKLAATVEPALAEARRRRHQRLATRAREAAMSANAGAVGLGETLGGLQEGRVAHLLLASDGRWSGSRTPDGLLVPDGEVPPGVDPAHLRPEPDLGERMIELAFQENAEVTMLEPADAASLADAGGVGAVLRW
jgi:hypothetical protein